MTTIKPRDLSGDAMHLLKDYMLIFLTYFWIVASFGVVPLVVCVIWLLVWLLCREWYASWVSQNEDVAPGNCQTSANRVRRDVGISATRGKITDEQETDCCAPFRQG